MEPQIFPTQEKLKSYWQRPGGKFGTLAGIALVAGIAYYVLPILTKIVWNTLNFGIGLACLGLFLYAVTHRKLRMSLFYLYEILMKKLVGIVIEMDPFIIAEDYVKDMEKERENLQKEATKVGGQKEKTALKIKEKQKEIQKLISKAEVAREKNMTQELGNITRQIGRLKDYIEQITPIKNDLERIGDYLDKIYKNSDFIIQDARNELEVKKDLYKAVTSGNKALISAMKIFKGDPEKKLMVEQSMEFLKDDIGTKLSNMKRAISDSQDYMKSIDLENATYQKEGLRLLDEIQNEKVFQLDNGQKTYVPASKNQSAGDLSSLLD